METGRFIIPYDGPQVAVGTDLILDAKTGQFKPRLWGRRPIRRVTMATVLAVQDKELVIQLPTKYGTYRSTCPDCAGLGVGDDGAAYCPTCKGWGKL